MHSHAQKTVVILFLLLLALPVWAQAGRGGVSDARFSHLRHGVNLSEWFAQSSDYTPQRLQTYTTAEDIALVKRMGFDHVRLSIDPQPLWRPGRADALPAGYLAYLDKVVDTVLSQGLAIIVDIHPESDFKRRVATDNQFVEQFGDFWRALARHYSDRDPERMFFEVMNEPEVEDGYRWYGIQAALIAAIRQGAPQHTIIASGHRWSSLNELLWLQPYADGNIVYNFHFYDPHIFTHQGATWGVNSWHYLEHLPYPSTPANVADAAAAPPRELARADVVRYGLDQWNAQRIDAEIAQAAAWAKANHLRLTCNEFGVYRDYSRPAERAAWIHDVRSAFEKYGIGWTMWDYQGGFGVVTKAGGQTTPDNLILTALGLSASGSAATPAATSGRSQR